ncbi:MAG: RNA-guided pseudouridylation complex pseudouridine synthase subunit Cbf5 [Candidatus Micrarchaeota archaeon]
MEKKEIITKKDFETDANYGKSPGMRATEELLELGIAVIDKPAGPSSHEVSAWARRILEANKSGHSGTLDPRVSGVLPVGLNRSTRAMSYLAKSDKEYVCVIRFHEKLPEQKIRNVMGRFVGEITQTPPLRSAVARRPRKRKVYYLNILEINAREVLFAVGCQAGTYVRKLCFDMGKLAGRGAHMSELRRTKAGVFSEKDSHSLQDLSDAYWLWKETGNEGEIRKCVLPLETGISAKKIWVADQAVEALCFGAPLAAPGVSKFEDGFAQGDDIAVLTLKGELVSLGKALISSGGLASLEKGLIATTERVVMKKGIYPRCW